MAQSVQELINKIKAEGVEKAESEAGNIKTEAQKKADALIKEAKSRAAAITTEAENAARKIEASAKAAISQAARNTLLSVKQDIQDLLKKIISRQTGAVLSGDALKNLVTEAVRSSSTEGEIILSLREEDIKGLGEGFAAHLQEELKKGVTFKTRTDRAKGFEVSYDGGKSSFDFTDEALAEFFYGSAGKDIAKFLKD